MTENDGDSWRAEASRMVDGLGPLPPEVARAMRTVPRHRFLPETFRAEAYRDEPVPLGIAGATISAPHMVALQLEWAELRTGLSVLEIGSGSGYLLALVAEIIGSPGRAVGIELEGALASRSVRTLRDLGYGDRIRLEAADGTLGFAPGARYDRIIVSCATHGWYRSWKEQLVPTGAVIAPVGDEYEQVLMRWRPHRSPPNIEEGPACRFVPLRTRRNPDI